MIRKTEPGALVQRPEPPEVHPVPVLSFTQAAEMDADAVPLSHYLWIVRRNRWRIGGFVAAIVIAAVIVSARLTPVFEATASIDIDRQTPTALMGQEASRDVLDDADEFMATQLKLVQSDDVLRPVAERFSLLEREGQLRNPARRQIVRAGPVTLKKLHVVRPPNTYLIQIKYRSPDRQLAADVANAIAASYVQHTFDIRYRATSSASTFMEKQLEELKANMERSSAALAGFERELNVIDPEAKTSILSARLLQLNTEYTNAETERVRKEAAWQSVKDGSLEAAQVSTQSDSLRKLEDRLAELEEQFSVIKANYGVNHPEYVTASAQLDKLKDLIRNSRDNIAQRARTEFEESARRQSMLKKSVAETKAEFDSMNARSFEYQSVKREADADKKFYEDLLRKIKEEGINVGFQNSSIRIADTARPPSKPVFPNMPLNATVAFLLSSVLAIGAAVLADVLDSTIRDPDRISREMKTEVVGTLPSVNSMKGRLVNVGQAPGLALSGGRDRDSSAFHEAIRGLRNSLLLTDFDRQIRSIMLTSAMPGEGKSTTACCLAIAHAQLGHKTLIIDGDLRRPSVHKNFGINGSVGLSSVLDDGIDWRDAVITLEIEANVDVLPAGPASNRASELMARGLSKVLEEAALDYELVIIDAPPLLGVAETIMMATLADGVLLVTHAGQTDHKAVASLVKTLRRVRANVVGIVMNYVNRDVSKSYRYYGSYNKYYYRAHDVETTA